MTPLPPHTSERYFDRWSWIALAVTGVFFVMGMTAALVIMNMPGDGWLLYYNDPSPPPLRQFAGDWDTPLLTGDRIIAVDGLQVHSWESEVPLLHSRWLEGQTVTYSILRDGQRMEVDVVLRRLGRGGILRSFWFTMQQTPTEWMWSLIAVVVFFLRPRNPAAQLMLLAFVPNNLTTKIFWAATTVSHNFAPAPVFYINEWITNFWGYLFFPSIILLVLSFPQPIYPLTRWPRAVPILLFGVSTAGALVVVIFQLEALIPIILIAHGALLIFSLGSSLQNARKLANHPVARAQALWVVFGFGLCIPPLLIAYLLDLFGVLVMSELGWIYEYFMVLVLPICLAIAITRYRLFDIDVIIRRTLQYSLVTLLLALVYFIGVVVLQSIISSISGIQNNEQIEDTAVIFSTLAIAALFTPVRRRVQQFIDRRFFRSSYNAEQILASFAVNTRQEVGLEPLSTALLTAVEETMQPEAVHLWIKPGLKDD